MVNQEFCNYWKDPSKMEEPVLKLDCGNGFISLRKYCKCVCMKILKITQLYTLNGYILGYGNDISRDLFQWRINNEICEH